MNKLPMVKRAAIVRALVEGSSIRAIGRMVGVSKDTVLKLLVELGDFCAVYQDYRLRNLQATRIQADEIWAFVGAKARNARQSGQGDIWTYTAIDAESKLMVSWLVGGRTQEDTNAFMLDLADRFAKRIQLTTDGNGMYLTAVRRAFDIGEADYDRLIEQYGQAIEQGPHRRYSPMVCTGSTRVRMIGRPDIDLVSPSYAERANLSMRMGMRRFTRLSNGFSKKAENHEHAVSLHFMHYNFCRSHTTLTKAARGVQTTPAVAAGVVDHVWTIEEMLGLMDGTTLVGL